jgi:hypothetical protein
MVQSYVAENCFVLNVITSIVTDGTSTQNTVELGYNVMTGTGYFVLL